MHYKVPSYSLHSLPDISNWQFKAIYGLTLLQVSVTWKLMYEKFAHQKGFEKKHLLWTLRFMKHYQTIRCLAHDLNASPNTIKKWVWYTVTCLSKLKVVSILQLYYPGK